MPKKKKLPLGIGILAVLNALAGISLVLLGIALNAATLGTVTTLYPALVVVLGVANFVVAWGLWTGQTWAWYLALVFRGLGLVVNIWAADIAGLAIDLIVLVYLLKGNVQDYFKVDVGWSWA